MHDKVALFGGAATVPELRRRGLQTALLQARMLYAFDHGCDLAMMVAVPGSDSQRNAERRGFRVATPAPSGSCIPSRLRRSACGKMLIDAWKILGSG